MGQEQTAKAREVKALWELQFTTDGVSFDEIRHVPCVILLGEPGMGKILRYCSKNEEQCLSTRISENRVARHTSQILH